MYVWPFELLPTPATTSSADLLPPATLRPRNAARLPGWASFLASKLAPQQIVLPSDTGYDAARETYNPRFNDVRPLGIVFCREETEVAACLEAISRFDLRFRLRSAGHSLAGFSSLDDGIVIDVSEMNHVSVDVTARQATAQSGCTMGQLKAALQPSGLMLPLGGVQVGVAGFVQGGGFGTSSRTLGMHSDHVIAVRVMLADGHIVEASDNSNHDLWWACRGGTGGNFGVLLEVRYLLHPSAEWHPWSFSWPIRQAADRPRAVAALLALQDGVLPQNTTQLNAGADLRHWPDAQGGEPATLRLYVYGSYFGSEAQMQAALEPLARLPGQEPFVRQGYRMLSNLRQARFVSRIAAPEWQAIVADFADHANLYSTLTADAWGGAINAYPVEASSFVHRHADFNLYVTGFWCNAVDEQRVRVYLGRWRERVEPYCTDGVYQNFADADCPDFALGYWGRALPALAAVKAKYDPEARFRFAQMIPPADDDAAAVTWPPLVAQWLARPIV